MHNMFDFTFSALAPFLAFTDSRKEKFTIQGTIKLTIMVSLEGWRCNNGHG